jgi:RNase P subunit RPR2
MMPGSIGTTFGDLVGKLTVLRVQCTKCGRFGRYPLRRLIDQRDRDVRIID